MMEPQVKIDECTDTCREDENDEKKIDECTETCTTHHKIFAKLKELILIHVDLNSGWK